MRRPPRPTRTDTRLPYTTLLRSHGLQRLAHRQNTLRCCGEAHMRAVDLDSPVALPGASLGAAGQDHAVPPRPERDRRSEEHTSELQSLMRISYAVFCLNKNSQLSRHTDTREATDIQRSARP